ncbi:hypothetical protein [Janthinobacterium sp. PSPC1-1]|uniref:hypothetical protein n=1 Tax=Janthinobacterium sp. PSPC1-1 TaxID=2804581 RepID=UPI003CE686E1
MNKENQVLDDEDNIVEFYNRTDVLIFLHIEWIGVDFGFKNTVLKPGETIQVPFNGKTARLCSRSDGTAPKNCSADSVVAHGGQFFDLEINGEINETV